MTSADVFGQKRAKMLDACQEGALLAHVATTRYPARNRVIVLLAFKAGLRAMEIAGLRWRMVTAVDGTVDIAIMLEHGAAKGKYGRPVPLQAEVRAALALLRDVEDDDRDDFAIRFRNGSRDRVIRSAAVQQLFRAWYRALRFSGASSHSGRRTFATRVARHLVHVPGASIRDLQALLGHADLNTTQRYIDENADAQRQLVELP